MESDSDEDYFEEYNAIGPSDIEFSTKAFAQKFKVRQVGNFKEDDHLDINDIYLNYLIGTDYQT